MMRRRIGFTLIEPPVVREGKTKGFTLIELLVVIAIISLLVSILLPSLQSARELAIEVKCVTQLHSLVTAVHMYGNDYDQVLFWRLPNITTQGMDYFAWVGRETGNTYFLMPLLNNLIPRPLNAYVNDTVEIAHCPGDTSSYETGIYGPGGGGENWYETVGNSYAFNCVGHPFFYSTHPDDATSPLPYPGGLRGKSLDNIERPSQTVFALDSSLFRVPDDLSSWHRDGMANMAFIDGHAELRTLPMENPYYGGDNEGIYWDETEY